MEDFMQDHTNNPEKDAISDAEIKKIAQLSMLNLSQEELEKLKTDFSNTLKLFETLEKKDVNTVEVSYESNKISQPRRRDEVIHDTKKQKEQTANISPYLNKKTGCFDVPPVIETE
jgi:aspartyl/glutamyl-tRNA(Asn/Gln) amidotransferase C subunit